MQAVNNQQGINRPVGRLLWLAVLVCAGFTAMPALLLAAESEWSHCRVPVATHAGTGRVVNKNTFNGEWSFSADQAVLESGQYRLQGNVIGKRGRQRLSARS